MAMAKLPPLALLLLLLSLVEASAQPARVLSFGANPCGDFIAESAQGQWMFGSWAVGFISGANIMDTSDARFTGAGFTPDSVLLWLKNYCSTHPLDPFVKAVVQLRQELASQEGLMPK